MRKNNLFVWSLMASMVAAPLFTACDDDDNKAPQALSSTGARTMA